MDADLDRELTAVADRLREGDDRSAVGDLYALMASPLRAYLHAQVSDPHAADDLLEQTFLEVMPSLGKFRGDGRALRVYLLKAARHNVYDWRRRQGRREPHPIDIEHLNDVPDPLPGPAEQATTWDEFGQVAEALHRLTDDQREVVTLRLVSGLSVAETARLLDKTDGAVKALLHRAVRALREHLEVQSRPSGVTTGPTGTPDT